MKEENGLLEAVANGDELVFGQLYRQWQPPLAAFIFKITKSKELTAEIVQDVFMKIWLNRELLSGVSNFKSYLFVACRNHALNALKATVREAARFKEWQATHEMDQEFGGQPVAQEKKHISTLIDAAIDRLPPRQKDAYILHYHEGLTYQQVAEKLGVGRETVKTHLQLAVKSLTAFLQNRREQLLVLVSALGQFVS